MFTKKKRKKKEKKESDETLGRFFGRGRPPARAPERRKRAQTSRSEGPWLGTDPRQSPLHMKR